MKIRFDAYDQPVPTKVHLGTSNNKLICTLNSIDEDTFLLTNNVNNTDEVDFEMTKYIDVDGEEVLANGYELIDTIMRIYIDNVGWFALETPQVENEGYEERKIIHGESAEIEFANHNIVNLKINNGTTDSYEMLDSDNVIVVDGVEFAKEQIKFYNPDNENLSFLDILLKVTDTYGWSIKYVDDIPKEYKSYEDGELVETYTKLADEIGYFDVEVQDLYSFLTQDVAQYFDCLFVFDYNDFTISAYHPEDYGSDTNINIGFRNIQQTNDITANDTDIYTRYTVSGGEDLQILYVNFGYDVIENIDYFLNEKYLSAETIEKYKLWKDDLESARPDYIEYTRLYNAQQAVISELYNRLPLDDCSTDWSTFTDDELQEAYSNYYAQLKGYESYYVDSNGNFDETALANSPDANDYYQIRDVILPSIRIEMENRELPLDQDPTGYIDSYLTNWDLYGLDELEVKLQTYINTKETCEAAGYDEPYTSESGHTQSVHEEMYEKYLDACNQLDPDYVGSCQEAYNQRLEEIKEATTIQDEYNEARLELAKIYDKTLWEHDGYYFTESDLKALSHLYIDTTYNNENMFLTSLDDTVTAIDEQLKLLGVAEESLEIYSQPQYEYQTTLDNFLALIDYKNYIENLNLGDFLYLGVDDNNVVKLRAISMSYNPMKMDNNLEITFSNMLRSKSQRNDFVYLINSSTGSVGTNTVVGTSGNYQTNGGINLTSGLIDILVSNGAFTSAVEQTISNNIGYYLGDFVSVGDLTNLMLNSITADNAFFEYLQAELISADKIVAESGEFQDLYAFVAAIDNLLAGNVSAALEHVIELTAQNVIIDEAVIRDLIAANITVDMLQSSIISTDQFYILSDSGGLSIVGDTMQFTDKNGTVRIQIGQDATGNFTFVLYDETGEGVLIDSTGIYASAISDGLIVDDMIADSTISKDKLGFTIVETDDDGNISITNVLDADGNNLGVTFTELQHTVEELGQIVSDNAVYTVVMQNEYQNIPCANGLAKENFLIEIPFTGYRGSTQVPVTAVVGELPSGVTLATNTPSTEDSDGLIVLNVANQADFGGANVWTGYVIITFSIDDVYKSAKHFTWTKTNDGNDGVATFYVLESSTPIVTKTDEEFSPESIEFNAYIKQGTSKEPYEGVFIISESTDNNTYSTKYLSSQGETSVFYTPSSLDVVSVRCLLCESDDVSSELDRVTVPVITDADYVSSELTKVTTTVTQLSQTVDTQALEIASKASQTDITDAINNYDGSTVESIRTQVSENVIAIDNITTTVSDVESKLETKADGTDVQGLTEKVTSLEQDAEGFKQTVEETYAKKSDVDDLSDTVENYYSEFIQTATEINTTIGNMNGEISSIQETATSLEARIENAENQLIDISATVDGIKISIEDYSRNSLMSEVFYYAVGGDDIVPPSEPHLDDDTVAATVGTAIVGESMVGTIGWSTEFPTTDEDCYVWYASLYTKVDGTTYWSDPVCITDGYVRSVIYSMGVEFDILSDMIYSKVWMDDIKEVSDQVTVLMSQYTEILQTAQDIEMRVTSIEESAYDYEQRIATLEVSAGNIYLEVANLSSNIATNAADIAQLTVTTDNINTSVTSLEYYVRPIAIYIEYMFATSASDTVAPVEGTRLNGTVGSAIVGEGQVGNTVSYTVSWSPTISSLTSTNCYLWYYKLVTYSDGTFGDYTPAVLGTYSDISNAYTEYYLSESDEALVGDSWGDECPEQTGEGYLWTRLVVINKSNSTTYQEQMNNPPWREQIDSLAEIRSSIVQTAENITLMFETRTSILETVTDELQNTIKPYTTYFTFGTDGLRISKTNSMFALLISNDRISFLDGRTEVAYISNSMMYISEAEILNSLKIGDFKWVLGNNGDLNLTKVGDA